MPRNVQKDPEASLTWVWKDEIVGRGKVYYAKLARGKTMFLAPRMIPYFHAVWGVRRSEERRRLSRNAQAILHVLRKEWEMLLGPSLCYSNATAVKCSQLWGDFASSQGSPQRQSARRRTARGARA
jgi:hypothetical protein